jgi:DNA-binding NtrC family response regulator
MKTCRIVAVDDDPAVLGFLGSLFEMQSWEHRLFQHPSDALGWLREHTPAVVVTDINMPGMRGEEFARRVRRQAPAIRLVAFTGSVELESLDQSLFAALLRKPCGATALITALQRQLDAAAADRERDSSAS